MNFMCRLGSHPQAIHYIHAKIPQCLDTDPSPVLNITTSACSTAHSWMPQNITGECWTWAPPLLSGSWYHPRSVSLSLALSTVQRHKAFLLTMKSDIVVITVVIIPAATTLVLE
jgi:hypothetical protein